MEHVICKARRIRARVLCRLSFFICSNFMTSFHSSKLRPIGVFLAAAMTAAPHTKRKRHPSRLGASLAIALLWLAGSLQSASAAAPANDDFAAPTVIGSTLPKTVTGSNVDATLEAGEPDPSLAETTTSSVWFDWTSTVNGVVRVDTLGSDFDTRLVVWTGSSLATLSEIAANNRGPRGIQSLLHFTATAGTTYHIAVYGDNTNFAEGDISLNIQTTGTISGTVTDASGNPLEGGYVQAYKYIEGQYGYWGGTAEEVYTAADGTYTLSNLPSGTYRVGFEDYTFYTHLKEFYNGQGDVNDAADVTVVPFNNTPNIDASMEVGGTISGTVTVEQGGAPLQFVRVKLYTYHAPNDLWIESVYREEYTAADGTYSIPQLQSGTYRVGFFDENGRSYLEQFFPGADDAESGTDVTVTVPNETANIDAAMVIESTISGTVTEAGSGTPLAGIHVSPQKKNNSGEWISLSGVFGYTEADGTYSIGKIKGGTYRVLFHDQDNNIYIDQYYDGKDTPDSATDVVVAPPADRTNIDAVMEVGGSISGTVTAGGQGGPLAGVLVSANRDVGLGYLSQFASDTTAADGTYTLSGLASADYKVGFYTVTSQPDYSGGFYNGSSNNPAGDDVTVSAPNETAGIDAALAPKPGSISGTVTAEQGGALLEGVQVSANRDIGQGLSEFSTATTAADGTYTLYGLDSGDYKVFFSSGNFSDQWYDASSNNPTGVDVTVSAPDGRTGINAALKSGIYQWDPVSGAEWYNLYILKDGALWRTFWVEAGDGSAWTPEGNLPSGDYKWWVRSWTEAEGNGDWLEQVEFAYAKVELLSPEGAISETRPLFEWTQSSHARAVNTAPGYYKLYIQRDGELWKDLWITGSTTTTWQQPSEDGAMPPGNYKFWVAPWNQADGQGIWSESMEFALGLPELIGPDGPVTEGAWTPEFTWTESPSADWYRLYIARNGEAFKSVWIEGSASTTHQEIEEMPAGEYEFWVNPWSESGGFGPWVGPMEFSIGMPVPLTPTGVQAGGETQPLFTWTGSSKNEWYQIYLERNGAYAADPWLTSNEVVNESWDISVPNPNSSPANLILELSSGEYKWWIRAYSAAGGTGSWIEGPVFTIPEV